MSKSMQYGGDEVGAVVLDIESGSVRAGSVSLPIHLDPT